MQSGFYGLWNNYEYHKCKLPTDGQVNGNKNCGKLTAYTGTDNKHTGAYRTVFKVAIPIRYNVV